MKVHPIPAVECALLHSKFAQFDLGELHEHCLRLFHSLGVTDVPKIMPFPSDKDLYLVVGDMRVMVSQNDQPLDREGFKEALDLPITHWSFPDAKKCVEQQWTCHSLIPCP